MNASINFPRVGVGVVVRRAGKVLLGLRQGNFGAREWCFPGGHLEFGEEFVQCAERELSEECGLHAATFEVIGFTNDVFDREAKHYITCFVRCEITTGNPEVLEPEKISEWTWFDVNDLPQPLFLPIRNLLKSGIQI